MNIHHQQPNHPKRQVFFSFHYGADHWRAQQIRNAGVVEGNEPISPNQWESVKRLGDESIKRWINEQIASRSCVVVLIGAQTAHRPWVRYEIEKAWNTGKALFGIHIHALRDQDRKQASLGLNPFDKFTVNGRWLTNLVTTYNPRTNDSKAAYDYITSRIAAWVEKAIAARSR